MKSFRSLRHFGALLALLALACRREEPTPAGTLTTANGSGRAPAMSSPFDPSRPPDRLAPPEAPFGVGEWASTDTYRLRVVEVQKCDVESYFAPRAGHIKLGAKLELEALTDSEVPSNQLYAVLVDAEGTRYPATLAGCQPALATTRLARRKSTSGFVSFEIPQDASGLTLRYEPVVVGRADSSVAFSLGR